MRKSRGLNRVFVWLCAFVAIGTVTAGCDNGDPSENGPPQDGKTYYSRTIVHFNADGTVEQRTDWITPEQQEAQKATRAGLARSGLADVAALTVDPGCANESLWLFDQPNIQGSMLCLSGTGTLDLGGLILRLECNYFFGYCFPRIVTWRNNVRSLWTGTQVALLGRREPNDPEHVEATSAASFNPWTPYGVVFTLMEDAIEQLP
jgi:hypothetical protein